MPVPTGGDPDSLLLLARTLDEAAAELRRLQTRAAWGAGAARLPGDAAALAARVRVWVEAEASDVRRRARILADERRLLRPRTTIDIPRRGQHGRNRKRLTDEEAQVEETNATLADPAASEEARNAAGAKLRALQKGTGDRHSRRSGDVKPPPKSPRATKTAQAARKATVAKKAAAAKKATGLAAVGVGLWWAGKALSPLCGPAAPVCAVAG